MFGSKRRVVGAVLVLLAAGGALRAAPPDLVRAPALCPGKLAVVGTEVRRGEVVPAEKLIEIEVAVLAVVGEEGTRIGPDERVVVVGRTEVFRRYRAGDELAPGKLALGREKKRFRKLEVGAKVEEGQVLGLVAFDLAVADVEVRLARLDAAEQTRVATDKSKEEALRRVQSMEKARTRVPGCVSDDDYYGARLTAERYRSEAVAAKAQVLLAAAELRCALTKLSMHEVRSPATGRVWQVCKVRGEYIRLGRTVVEVEVEAPAPKR